MNKQIKSEIKSAIFYLEKARNLVETDEKLYDKIDNQIYDLRDLVEDKE